MRKTRIGLALAGTLAVSLAAAPAAIALPDFDGDGHVAGDCAPLDAAIHPGATDDPDLGFEDSNCDGIDGDESKAVFVAPGGDNANTGTIRQAPKQDIQVAISQAAASGKDVYVAGGAYTETLQLADNVRIYGGYVPITGARSRDQATVIVGRPQAALADDDQGVVLQLLTLRGQPLLGAGQSAYGLRAVRNSRVVLRAVTSEAADAAAGSAGSSPAQPPQPTRAGAGSCAPGDAGRGAPGIGATIGGVGGVAGFGNATGGGGGTGSAGASGGPAGGANANGGPGASSVATGFTGSNGATPAFTTTLAAEGGWVGASATGGGNGGNGGSGGGGGGSGGVSVSIIGTTFNAPGGGGGGGGAGGAAGTAGTAGGAGGASFGAFVHNSHLVALDSTLKGGRGGNGGNGGDGAPGGLGGPGGFGGNPCGILSTFVSGGNGGAGANGGPGGDGGGGTGGPSAAVFRTGAGAAYTARGTTEQFGSAGAAGRRGASGPVTAAGNGQAAASIRAATAPEASTSDFDGDGITDAGDVCPESNRGGADVNADGCPDRPAPLADTDGDLIPDTRDGCVTVHRGVTDVNEDGCPDPTGPIGIDADRDGFFAGQDCNDNNARIRPGAREVPGNRVDENCDGIAAQFAILTSKIPATWKLFLGHTQLTSLKVTGLPRGSKVTLTCRKAKGRGKGPGCPFARRTLKIKRGRAVATPLVRKARFKAGAVLEVRVTAPRRIGLVRTLEFRSRKDPKITNRCLRPGAKRPHRC